MSSEKTKSTNNVSMTDKQLGILTVLITYIVVPLSYIQLPVDPKPPFLSASFSSDSHVPDGISSISGMYTDLKDI